ncbi:MAG: DUF790 family protein [Oligoflexus sp.]|nr:DUF790 family protein [Oligoflexus sp.]
MAINSMIEDLKNTGLNIKEFRPHFLDSRDEPWVSSILEEYRRFEGKPLRDWYLRLREPLPFYCPYAKLKYFVKALDEVSKSSDRLPKKKLQELRRLLFHQSESFVYPSSVGRIAEDINFRQEQMFGTLATHTLLGPLKENESIESILFADLPSEKLVGRLRDDISIHDLILSANTYLLKGIIQRSERVDIFICGKVRPIVRQALLRGLVCVVKPLHGDSGYDIKISLSGPLALFRHARLYGRLLVEVLPFLPNCDRFHLNAIISDGEKQNSWIIKSGDPIKPAENTAYDSQIERRFARDFMKMTNDYDLIREPQAIIAGESLIFPDFAIRHRTDTGKSWLLEIVGYWTDNYLKKKIENLRLANIQHLIICVSKRLGSADKWPDHAQVIVFDRWIDPIVVLKAVAAGYSQNSKDAPSTDLM